FELVSYSGAGALLAPSLLTGMQTAFYDTVGVVEDHIYGGQFDNGGSGADVVEEDYTIITPTVQAARRGGLWLKGNGRWTDREMDITYGPFDVTVDTDQTTWSILGGADYTAGDVRFGLFGGYISSDLEFNFAGADATYRGGTVGGYAAYNNGAFYADILGKYDFLDVKYRFFGNEADADGHNIGVLANVGYRHRMGSAFIEPLVSGAFVHSTIDNFSWPFGTISFEDGNSARLGAGARIGTQINSGATITEFSLLGRVWNEFADDNVAVISDGISTWTHSDEIKGVFGEVTGTITLKSADSGWSGFISATGTFGNDTTSYGGSLGLRMAF